MATKKLKKKVQRKPAARKVENPVVESARDIWLAGLGAFSMAQEESSKVIDRGSKLFDKLVKEGGKFEKKTRKDVEGAFNDIRGEIENRVTGIRSEVETRVKGIRGEVESRVDGIRDDVEDRLEPMLKQGKGAIVNFGSIWGGVGAAGVIAYCASKGAVHQITRSMALEYVKDGIRVNAVCPGNTDTDMVRQVAAIAGRQGVVLVRNISLVIGGVAVPHDLLSAEDLKVHQVQVHGVTITGHIPDFPLLCCIKFRILCGRTVPGNGTFHLTG